MTYRVEELASAAEIAVDTVRFYQRKGLLEPPDRLGRTAVYSEDHRQRLLTIRQLSAAGFTLAQIKQLFDQNDDALLRTLIAGSMPESAITKSELAAQAGVDETIIDLAVSIGLLSPSPTGANGDDQLFPAAAAVGMLRAASAILATGIPLDELAELATEHAKGVAATVDRAVDLFREHVRPHYRGQGLDDVFKELLAQTTLLVAEHFHRTLTSSGLEHLRDGSDPEMVRVLAEAESNQLAITSEWS